MYACMMRHTAAQVSSNSVNRLYPPLYSLVKRSLMFHTRKHTHNLVLFKSSPSYIHTNTGRPGSDGRAAHRRFPIVPRHSHTLYLCSMYSTRNLTLLGILWDRTRFDFVYRSTVFSSILPYVILKVETHRRRHEICFMRVQAKTQQRSSFNTVQLY